MKFACPHHVGVADFFASLARYSQVSTTVSGLSDKLPIPSSINQFVQNNGDTNGAIKRAFEKVNQQNADLVRALDNMKRALSP